MKITYLGQAGFLIEADAKTIIIDPYLSDSVAKVEPQNKRRQPIDERFLKVKPDIIVCTHAHGDHFDVETLKNYLTEDSGVTFLSPRSAWAKAREFKGNNNYVLFNEGTEWTDGNITIKAVKAEHSDEYAIGVILSFGGKNYYFTGDTLYNKKVISSVKDVDIYAVFLPVNGRGNNMNKADAVKFYKDIKAKYFVPVHVGMFDDIGVEDIIVKNKVVPTIYQEIEF